MEPSVTFWSFTGLQPVLTEEQEALLGCGPFYGTQCDIDGVGLVSSELSALLRSWPPSEAGTWDTTDASRAQPGTVGYEGDTVCARQQGGMTSILPGCRGPDDPGYDPLVDGTTTGFNSVGVPYPEERRHPFTDQVWSSSMAVLSWNLLGALVALSSADDPTNVLAHEFDPDDPLRLDGCSLANPLPCCSVASALGLTTQKPEEDPGQLPLRHWLWETGAEYLVTEATGDLDGFLGWALFAYGPEQSRRIGDEVGVPFFLSPPDPRPPIPDSPLIVRHPGLDGIPGTDDDNVAGVAYGVVQELLRVEIDIEPWDDRNAIDPTRRRLIPVALLGSESFDVDEVDVATLAFGPAGAAPALDLTDPLVGWLSRWDVNRDGEQDLLSYYWTDETGVAFGDTEACLTGESLDGLTLEGCDAVVAEHPWSCGLGVELALVLAPLLGLRRRSRRGA
jgi:hypothetical protein